MTHHIDLSTIELDKGSHPEDGRGCLLEWTARFAGLPVTDHPACTSPVLAAFGIAWNDALDDVTRQRLIPFIPRLVDTAGDPEADEVRAWLATDWLVRVQAVAWLRLAKLTDHADALAALPEISSSDTARSAQESIEAAWDAARAAARAGAWDAAGAAAWAAARAGAWDAAGAAAWAALQPTVTELQASAFDLFDRMIAVRTPVAA